MQVEAVGTAAPGRDQAHAAAVLPAGGEMLLSIYREERGLLLHVIRDVSSFLRGMEEDILQEAVERLLCRAEDDRFSWESRSHCRNYLLKTARNLAIDQYRREACRARLYLFQAELGPGSPAGLEDETRQTPDYEELAGDPCREGDPESRLLREEELARARAVISSLGEDERRLLFMREELSLPWETISSELGIRAEVLRMRYSRLKAWLRRALAEDCGS